MATDYTIIEDHDNGKHVWTHKPNFYEPVYPAIAEFIYKANNALKGFRDEWNRDHPDDPFARGLEIDVVPVMTDGMIMGFMSLSEIDGASYDYFPTKQVDTEDKTDG